ncbi:HDIG domain-containing protein [Dysgonomonas sp. 216]|uniref:HD family phosphohydrolase n=1 Tax=Dysgonomonas sp. 216 TaxID=2302934 RepID=UPI0013D53C8B|nr:HDIG domain-containing metalloprotein [Dysgonomonas sp. 216]NDW19179.1 HDIG domain-containing protein [Dysgonomonas sp. 216]
MKEIKNDKSLIPTPFLFVVAILIIAYFCPRDGKFKFTYSEGKPWKYGLVTASFDFPIYKPESQLEKERDSLMATYQSYYTIDESVLGKALAQLEADANAQSIPIEYIKYAQRKLKDVYRSGVLSAEDYDKIDQSRTKQIRLIEKDNTAKLRGLSSFLTSKSAYEKIIAEAPASFDEHIMQSMSINNYLYSNILYDNEKSSKTKDELLQKISPAQGMVQSGEKIIDRGEIVTSQTYNILNSLKRTTEERGGTQSQQSWLILGDLILIAAFMMSFMTYLYFYRPKEYYNRRNVTFMLLSVTIFCVLTGAAVDYNLFNVYIIPYTISTIMIRTFIDSRTATFTHLTTMLICSVMVPFPAEFLLLQIPVGFMCIFSLKDLSERSQLIKSSFFILLAYNIIYVGYILAQEGDITQANPLMFLYFGINFMFVMFTYLLVYISEKTFGFISGVSMIELSNTNKPLLQKLSELAPGTFQHSMQVSNLAAAVAVKIGANASLVRTGALYHDIGKMSNPEYFTENQAPGYNPHSNLSYKDSARIIIGHVEEGVKLAKKYNLPQQIIDFIETHHGTGKTKFFYNSYKNEHPDEEIDESDFSYPGPNPFSKETAILMMADTVEAASRSLSEYTPETISNLVEKLIDAQLEDGLLKNAPITFSEIDTAKNIFKEKLTTIYHSRIKYPELIDNKGE